MNIVIVILCVCVRNKYRIFLAFCFMIKLTPRRAAAAGKYHAPPPPNLNTRFAAADQVSSAWGSIVLQYGIAYTRSQFRNASWRKGALWLAGGIFSLAAIKLEAFCVKHLLPPPETRSSADADKPARRVWRSVKVTKHSTIPYPRYSFLLCNSNFVFKTRFFEFLRYSTSKMPWPWNGVKGHSRSLRVVSLDRCVWFPISVLL